MGKVKAKTGWFPKATTVTGAKAGLDPERDKVTICLFYQYIDPLWTEERRDAAIALCVEQGKALSLGGRLRVAREGFNGTISGLHPRVLAFTEQLKAFDAHFQTADFKLLNGLSLDKAFKELTVYPVQELVHYGLSPADRSFTTLPPSSHLPPSGFHDKLRDPNAVVIDVRNCYESESARRSPRVRRRPLTAGRSRQVCA